jgi:hypothetical protein
MDKPTEPLQPRFVRSAYLKQIEEIEVVESWNEKNETLMIYTAMKIKSMLKKHILAGEYYTKRYTRIMYPTIGMSTISGLLGLNTFHLDDKLTQYITSSVSIVTALLLSYMKFMQFGELAEAHRRISKHYSTLYQKVARELFRDSSERVHADILIRQVGQESDDLFNVAPVIPEFIKRTTFNVHNWTIVSLREQLHKERTEEHELNDLEAPIYLSIRDSRYFRGTKEEPLQKRSSLDPVFRSWKMITQRNRQASNEIAPTQEFSLEFDRVRRGHV